MEHPKRLYVPLIGDLDFDTLQKPHFVRDGRMHPVTLMHPVGVERYGNAERMAQLFDVHPAYRTLHAVAQEAATSPERLSAAEDAVFQIDTKGGTGTVLNTMEWIANEIRDKGGRVTSIVGSEALSAGAHIMMFADETFCLDESQFIWHAPQRNPRGGELKDLAAAEGQTIEQFLRDTSLNTRFRMVQILQFLMGVEHRPPDEVRLSEFVRSRLLQTLYASRTDLIEDERLASELLRGTKQMKTFTIDYGFGDLAMTGAELHQEGLVRSFPNHATLRNEVRHHLGEEIHHPSGPLDLFFEVMLLNEIAREHAMPLSFIIDKDGDIAALSDNATPDQSLILRISELFQERLDQF